MGLLVLQNESTVLVQLCWLWGAPFPRQRPNYWWQGGEGGCWEELGTRRGRKLDPTLPFWAQRSHSPKKSPGPWPWLDRASGLTSDQYHCCPDPSRQSPIQAAPAHLQEKTRQTLMQIQRVGSHLPVFPQTIPGHGRKILPPSAGSGLQANCRDQLPSDTRSIWSWNVPSPNN